MAFWPFEANPEKGVPIVCEPCHNKYMEDMQQEIIDLEAKSAGTDFDSVVADIRSIYLPHCR